ncbi:flippase [Chloroflexota bacterium]
MDNRIEESMGKGTLYLMLANVFFLISSYAIHFGLGRYFGPETYGTYGIILALMTIVNQLLTTGFPQGASKYIAERSTSLNSIVRDSRRIQLLFSVLIFALYFGLAHVIANLFNDATLTSYIRISAFVIPFSALFAIYSYGYLNGLKEFSKQMKALTASYVVKVVAIFVLVLLGLGVKGAILGYLCAAGVGLLVAWKYVGPIEKDSTSFGWSRLIRFGVPAMLFSAILLLIMNIDLFAVKAIGGEDINTGLNTGYYTSANTLARVPYFIFLGLALALLPSISRSTSSKDFHLTTRYINQSMRYMLILLVPGVLLMSATSESLISLVYSSEYIDAADSLGILVFGLTFLTVFMVLANTIMGSGKPIVALGIALPLVAIDIILNIILIPRYELVGAAWATTITALIGMIASAFYVYRSFQALVSVKSFIKICLASLIIYVVALQISLSPSFLPFIYIGLFAVYFGLLLLMKEFNKEDVETFKRIFSLASFSRRQE